MISLYPSETFSITTKFSKAEIVEILNNKVIFNNYPGVVRRYNTKFPEKLFEGMIFSDGFQIVKAQV